MTKSDLIVSRIVNERFMMLVQIHRNNLPVNTIFAKLCYDKLTFNLLRLVFLNMYYMLL